MKIKMYTCGGERHKYDYPLGIGYLKAYCKNVDIELVKDRKDLINCDLIGLSSCDHGVREAVDILNNTIIPVCIGGQCTLWEGLSKYNFKYIVKGEGERTLQSIIDGEYKEYDFIEDIDTLPFPYRGKCGTNVPMLSSRGCPYSCKFCSSTKYWGKVRYHSPEYFISEIEYINKMYLKSSIIYIMDDLFVVNKKRLQIIHKMWMNKGYHKRFKLLGFIRSNVFDKEIGIILKEMGFLKLRFGAESGSDRMLKILNKRATVAQHQNTIDICNNIGIRVGASFMRNLPGETADDTQLTKKFIERNKGRFTVEGFYIFRPFAGTEFYKGEDLIKDNMSVRR